MTITTKLNIMKKVYVFFADGFEDIEALGTVDILRRGGVDVKTVSVMGREWVTTAHSVTLKADMLFEDGGYDDADMLVLPGGAAPGALFLNDHLGLKALLADHALRGTKIAAICAAPMVLGTLGLLRDKKATCYPGFEKYLDGATYTAELVTVDGQYTTGRGPGATFEFAYELLGQLCGGEIVQTLRDGMIYSQLILG